MRSFIDHITVTAWSLEAGAVFVRDALGVLPQSGGAHPRMATHNMLLRLGEAMFLEVIAPDPGAQAPARPRWFDLDGLSVASRPSLSTWVVRCGDIRAALAAAGEPLGEIEPMSRGALDWFITIPADGSLPLQGCAPALIEWHTDIHPAAGLEDKGLSLAGLEILHPDPGRVSRLLSALQLDGAVEVRAAPPGTPAHLRAHISTPRGLRMLCAPPPAVSPDGRA